MHSILSCLLLSFLLPVPGDFLPPPGTIRTGENRFIDKNLITWEDYYECLAGLNRENEFEKAKNMIPADTTVLYKGQPLWKNDAYREYPVTGLSRAQVEAYCTWRSEAVNLWKLQPEKRSCNDTYWVQFDQMDPEKQYKIVYQLPEAEDLKNYKAPKEKYWLNEYTREGDYSRKVTDKISNPASKVFRCVAIYEKIK